MRDQSEIECLLSRAYRSALPLQRLMAGLANVAKALNANDLCLAQIAAVHLRIPALPIKPRGNELEAADILIKSVDWNPALHPRAGTPPNPGWFAPTDGLPATKSYSNGPEPTGRSSFRCDVDHNDELSQVTVRARSESTNWPTLRNGSRMRRPKMKPQSGQRSKDTMPMWLASCCGRSQQ